MIPKFQLCAVRLRDSIWTHSTFFLHLTVHKLYQIIFKLVLLWLLPVTGLLSCKPEKPQQKNYTIGFSQCTGSDLWRKTMLEEMKMELSLHPGTSFQYTDAEGSSARQIEQVQDMLTKPIDLLIISPNEAQPLTPVVEQAYQRGIPVIIIDRKIASSQYTAYVGADNFQVGQLAAEYIGNIWKAKGAVLEIMGLPGSSPTIERQRGFADGISRFPRLQISQQVYGDWLARDAEAALLKAPEELKKAAIVFAHNDVMAAAATKVITQLKINTGIKVVGVDALPGSGAGLEMVSKGRIDASILYPTGGKEAISTAFKILNKVPFSKENILPSLVIDSSNVALMKLQWDKIRNQQKDIERQQALLREQQVLFKDQQLILNVTTISLVLAVILGGLAFYALLENRKVNKKLMEMSATAKLANEAKLNFFTNMSHEFRTPLTLILSPLEDLMLDQTIKGTAASNLKLIHKNAFRLLKLINQLISYRKLEHKSMKIRVSENNLSEFTKEIVGSFRHNAEKQHIELRFSPASGKIMAWFDANMLDKVIFNLLSNALKFTPSGGRILVTIAEDDSHIRIAVSDNGQGLSEEEAKRVFEHFYQGDPASSKGFGLGLSLSKELMLLHHGDISLHSRKEEGSTFTIHLPKGNLHFSPTEIAQETIDQSELYENARIYTTSLDELPKAQIPETGHQLKAQSILIIEDNPDLLNYLLQKLSEEYEIFIAGTAEQGMQLAFEQVPDLILSDVVLPGSSGTVLVKNLKSDFRTSHIPAILLTAQDSVEQQILGMEHQADAYMIKPFNYSYLLATIRNLLKTRELLKIHYSSDISSSGKPQMARNLDKKFLNDFAAIVEANLDNERFSVEDISRSIGISRVQLYRKVKAMLDCSITDYILNRRLKKASYLLLHEQHSIAEITYMVGFSTPNYFATVFKTRYGCTPSEFRKNQ